MSTTITFSTADNTCLRRGSIVHINGHGSSIVTKVEATTITIRPVRWYDRLRWRIQAWWWSRHHPGQSRWCWWRSTLLGKRIRGGAHWHVDRTNHWFECLRCGESRDSL